MGFSYEKHMKDRKRRRNLYLANTIVKFRCSDLEKMNLYNEATKRQMTFSTLIRESVNSFTNTKVFSDYRLDDCDKGFLLKKQKDEIKIIADI